MILILFTLVLVPIMTYTYYKKMRNLKLVILMDLLILTSFVLAIYQYKTGGYLIGEYHYSFWVMFPALCGFLIPAIHLQRDIEKYHRENLIELEKFTIKNGIDVLQLLSDTRVTKFMEIETQHDKEQTQEFCQKVLEPIISEEYSNIKRIVNSRGKKLVGLVYYTDEHNKTAKVNMFLFVGMQNRGRGSEAFLKTINEIKNLNHFEQIIVEVHTENEKMIKIVEKNNFTVIGEKEYFKNNKNQIANIYALNLKEN